MMIAHLVGDGAVGGGCAVEPLEAGLLGAAAAGLVEEPLDGQGRDDRAAHGPERLHLRRAQPVRVHLALASPQHRAPPPPRRRLLLRRHDSQRATPQRYVVGRESGMDFKVAKLGLSELATPIFII